MTSQPSIRSILIKVNGCKTSGEDCFFSKCTHWGCCSLLELNYWKEFDEYISEIRKRIEGLKSDCDQGHNDTIDEVLGLFGE